MEKRSMYPEMPMATTMPDQPPTYNQTFPSAPSSDNIMPNTMTSSGPQPNYFQPQQQQQPFVQQPQPQQVLIQTVQQPAIPPLGPRPCLVTCPSCRQQQMSNITYENTTKTHLFALALCVVGLCCCSCIPYLVDTCKNVNHYCRNCNAYLGAYAK